MQGLRAKGYVFGKGLETKSSDYARRWRTQRSSIVSEIDRQSPSLVAELRPLEKQFAELQGRSAYPVVALPLAERLESTFSSFDSKVSAVENTIRGMYDSFSNEINQFKIEVDRIQWMLTQLTEACFPLLATEGGLMAVKARYARDGKMDKDDPEGVLYLTDQRLVFEQKQEVATKKILFIATEKKMVQQVGLDAPLVLVEKVQATKKGLFGHEDHLEITFKSGAPVQSAWFHLNGQDCNWWQGLIGQARAGEFNDERAVAVDAKAEEKARTAPTICPGCGAPINQPVLRGMDSITCEYCHQVIRL